MAGCCVLLGCAGAGSGGPGVSTVTLGGADTGATTSSTGDMSATDTPTDDTSAEASTAPETTSTTDPDGTTTSSGSSDASTGPTEEICDGEDNDGDGLVDEVSENLDQCDNCSLHQYEDHAYWACNDPLDWVEARAACTAFGGDLASILDEDEDNFLQSIEIPDGETGRWLGATDAAQEGVWLWVDGSGWNYEGWGGVEPNNFDDIEHHLEISTMGYWADRPQSRENPYACKAPHTL